MRAAWHLRVAWRRATVFWLASLAIGLHFALILIVVTHLDDYMASRPEWQAILSTVNRYSMITFANRNFGFFAPSVSPDWNIEIMDFDADGHGHQFQLPLPSREMEVKMYSMLGHFSDSEDTMDLFARSWAVYAMNAEPDTARVTIRVTRNNLPTMEEFRTGKRASTEFFYSTTFER
jgi:hypothetical protein